MLGYAFMVNALLASGIVAVTVGIVGFLLVLRGQAFAGHALSHVGFAGAAGAALVGAPPLGGFLAAALLAGGAMGALGSRLAGRDVAVGMMLALSLALGLLLLHFNAGYAGQATSVLFGNVIAVSRGTVWAVFGFCAAALVALAVLFRPLLFVSLHPELAEARGVSPRLVGTLFLLVAAVAVAASTEVVGILLVFALLIGPPATANALTARLLPGIALSAAIGLACAWGGLTLAYVTDWPASAWIALLSSAAWLAARAFRAAAGAAS